MSIEVLTIVPARAGSKGIANKNIQLLGGEPLIHWILDSVRNAGNAGRVIVSTDSPEIKQIVERLGVEVPFLRPDVISQDLSTDLEFVQHALDFFKNSEGWRPDIVARFAPVTPLVSPATIFKSIELMCSKPESDSVRIVAPLSHHPFKSWRIAGEQLVPAFSKAVTNLAEPQNSPRQLMPTMYSHLAAAGVAWSDTYDKKLSTSGDIVSYVLADEIELTDINTKHDFALAECLMKLRGRQ